VAAAPGSKKLTIELDAARARQLDALAELYHATPERMVATWAASHIDRLASTPAPHSESSDATPDEEAT
jgi:predicted transcriptional regulator